MALAKQQTVYTIDEYLAMEREAEERHQYVDGQIYAMAGESLEHSVICFNLAAMLGSQLRGKPCLGLSPNMKIHSGLMQQDRCAGMFSYADASVVCGEPRFHDRHRDVLLNPVVIFEVPSPSTEAFDRGEKFLRYRTHLETLADFVLLSQDKPWAEHYQRQADGRWLYSSQQGLDAVLDLPAIASALYTGAARPTSRLGAHPMHQGEPHDA